MAAGGHSTGACYACQLIQVPGWLIGNARPCFTGPWCIICSFFCGNGQLYRSFFCSSGAAAIVFRRHGPIGLNASSTRSPSTPCLGWKTLRGRWVVILACRCGAMVIAPSVQRFAKTVKLGFQLSSLSCLPRTLTHACNAFFSCPNRGRRWSA
jgi:hypothetical protein